MIDINTLGVRKVTRRKMVEYTDPQSGLLSFRQVLEEVTEISPNIDLDEAKQLGTKKEDWRVSGDKYVAVVAGRRFFIEGATYAALFPPSKPQADPPKGKNEGKGKSE